VKKREKREIEEGSGRKKKEKRGKGRKRSVGSWKVGDF
jgi:hypothetical protein